jgi:hypothetical protein
LPTFFTSHLEPIKLLGAKLQGIFAKFSEALLLAFILAASCEVFGEGE